ncbi:MAG TPA: alanine racemase [Azospirillaceae bacterium]|nr:alanine racemase [Azospirillaceae bacterium]
MIVEFASSTASPATIQDLPTPALLLDVGRLRRNALRVRTKAQALGVRLRPHLKTAKSVEVARLLTAGGEPRITVSTLAEARYFFGAGFDDILYAVGIAPGKLPQVADLVAAGCRLTVVVDNVPMAEAVQRFAAASGLVVPVMIEVDTDGHRAGIEPDDPQLIDVAVALHAGPGVAFAGVMTHAGDSYGCRSVQQFEAMAAKECAGISRAAARLAAAGFPCAEVSIGSTPTAHYARALPGVTELRAGVYGFGDLAQAGLGTCAIDDIAISVLCSVIGHRPKLGRIIVDAGFLALSRDRSTATQPVDWGFGAVCRAEDGQLLENLVVSGTNQEHGIITARNGEPDYAALPIGSQLRILPNHACATAAAYDRYHLVEGSSALRGTWPRVNGW